MQKRLLVDGRRHEVTLTIEGERFRVAEGGHQLAGERRWSGGRLALVIEGRTREALVLRGAGGRYEVWFDSERHVVEEERRGAGGNAGGAGEDDLLIAPMPAKVIRIAVAVGDTVEEGQTLVVLESMKMELAVTSPRAGTVARVAVEAGQIITAGVDLVELAKAPAG